MASFEEREKKRAEAMAKMAQAETHSGGAAPLLNEAAKQQPKADKKKRLKAFEVDADLFYAIKYAALAEGKLERQFLVDVVSKACVDFMEEGRRAAENNQDND